ISEATIVVGILAAWRHHNCHVQGCPRLGRHVEGTAYILLAPSITRAMRVPSEASPSRPSARPTSRPIAGAPRSNHGAQLLERTTGLEPATSTLARSRSTN